MPRPNRALVLIAFVLLAGCLRDESATGYAGGLWQLRQLSGQPLSHPITLDLRERGQVSGMGPCNRYRASLDVPYPWFGLGPIQHTRAACPELLQEEAHLALLERMSFAEVSGPVLILSNEAGERLDFHRAQP